MKRIPALTSSLGRTLKLHSSYEWKARCPTLGLTTTRLLATGITSKLTVHRHQYKILIIFIKTGLITVYFIFYSTPFNEKYLIINNGWNNKGNEIKQASVCVFIASFCIPLRVLRAIMFQTLGVHKTQKTKTILLKRVFLSHEIIINTNYFTSIPLRFVGKSLWIKKSKQW